MIKTFEAKFANMRKPQTFVVYPRKSESEPIKIQSDKCIGMFDPETGKGVLNTRGKYFIHLNTSLGATLYTLPPDVLAKAKECGAVTADGAIKILG